ncbi:MAG: hypothetical protein QW727_02620 [Candidatus Pacearchaeota archaeon]
MVFERTEISFDEFNFFKELVSIKYAVTLSVLSPVVQSNFLTNPKKISPFSSIFYDCKNDNKEEDILIKGRILLARQDIEEHLIIHNKIRLNFNFIGIYAKRGRLEKTIDYSRDLFENLIDYRNLVYNHKKRLDEDSFLFLPTCMPGHYFNLGGYISECSFNSEQNNESFEESIKKFYDIINKVEESNRFLKIQIKELEDNRNCSGTSLSERLNLTKGLLERVGYR